MWVSDFLCGMAVEKMGITFSPDCKALRPFLAWFPQIPSTLLLLLPNVFFVHVKIQSAVLLPLTWSLV